MSLRWMMKGKAILRAEWVGPLAATRVADTAQGKVVAAFEAVIYAQFDAGLVCIARSGIDAGPLSIVCAPPANTDFRKLAPVGTKVSSDSGREGLCFDLTDAKPWRPLRIDASNTAQIAMGLARLRCATRGLPGEGLAGFLQPDFMPPRNDLIARRAQALVLAARRWASAETTDLNWAGSLIGLGPGLTPSGDDFLGGMMVALHGAGSPKRAQVLWETISGRAAIETNLISFALLEAASLGLGSDSLHRVIRAALSGQHQAASLKRMVNTGHSSGLDALAGVVTVLDAVASPAQSIAS